MKNIRNSLFWVFSALAIVGLFLFAYVVWMGPKTAVPPASETSAEDMVFVTTEKVKPVSRCDISATAVWRSSSWCFPSPASQTYTCLQDIVAHQTNLLAAHDSWEFVCTPMLALRGANDTLPCICSIVFPGIDSPCTIVQPRIESISRETMPFNQNDGLVRRLPKSLTVVNQYSEAQNSVMQFQELQISRVAKALFSIGIDIYQDE